MRRNSNVSNDHDPSLLAIIDIETIVPTEHADPAGGFVKWVHHRPVVASILISEAMGSGRYEFSLTSVFCQTGGEPDFYAEVDRLVPNTATLCGWNTAGFDLPALALGAIASRAFAAANLSHFHRAHRFGQEHADLADLYGSRGAAPKPSLAEICGRLGVPVKTTSHGSEVSDLHTAGRHDLIAAYCEEDVAATAVAAWAWFAWREGSDSRLAEPLAAFSRWIEDRSERSHLIGIARCDLAHWARRRALMLLLDHASIRVDQRLLQERRRRIFNGEEPLSAENEPAF